MEEICFLYCYFFLSCGCVKVYVYTYMTLCTGTVYLPVMFVCRSVCTNTVYIDICICDVCVYTASGL